MSTSSIEIELENAMSNVGCELSTSMLSKCVAIAQNHRLTAAQMATSWEAHSLNCNVDRLDSNTFASYRATLLKSCKPEPVPSSGAVVSRHAMGKRSVPGGNARNYSPDKKQKTPDLISSLEDGYQTPHKEDETGTTQVPSLVTPPKSKPSVPPVNLYERRKNMGEVIATYNPHNLSELRTSKPGDATTIRPCVVTQPASFPNVRAIYRHMNDTDRAKPLDRQLTQTRTEMVQLYSIPTQDDTPTSNNDKNTPDNTDLTAALESIGVPRQSPQTNIGRICNEAHSGRINSTSVLLEGDSLRSNGARITLDIHSKEGLEYSLFPGQIVAVEGMNGTGRKITVDKLRTGLPLPIPEYQPTDEEAAQKVLEDDRGCRVMIVSGPYTTSSNLDYDPLTDIMDAIVVERPEVVVFNGPFVDMTQPLLSDGEDVVLEYLDEDGKTSMKRNVTYETLFAAKVAAELEQLFEDKPDLGTQFVLVPSMDDAVAEHVYPQPPLEDTIPGGLQIPHYPETETIPFGSLGLDTIETAGGRSPAAAKKHPRIHLVSNPSTLLLNSVTIGITSTDALLHLSTEEISANISPGSRLTRLAEHFLEQRSYYPMHPPPERFRMNVDVERMEAYSIPVRPDLLVLPSKLAGFAKDVKGGTVVVNPGHLVKGNMGGTYAMVDIHPKEGGEIDGDGVREVKDRVRVEIRRI